jgi:glutathione S-transferase
LVAAEEAREIYSLYARAGWGSVLVETQLAWYGLKYHLEAVGDLFKEPQARDQLVPANPIAQLPTLILPDGTVMTESAAITLLLADITGRDDLVPGAAAPERARFQRWLIFIPDLHLCRRPRKVRRRRGRPLHLAAPIWTPTRNGSGASWKPRPPGHGSSATGFPPSTSSSPP